MNGPFFGEPWPIKVTWSRKKMESQTSGMLIFAASHGRDDLVARLLEYQDVDVNERDRRGRTPLFGAASKGHARIVELLLEREDASQRIVAAVDLLRRCLLICCCSRNWCHCCLESMSLKIVLGCLAMMYC